MSTGTGSKRSAVVVAVFAALSVWVAAPAQSRTLRPAKVTVDRAVVQRHAALSRLGAAASLPAPPALAGAGNADGFGWGDAAAVCTAGVLLSRFGFLLLFRRTNRRSAAA